MMDLASDPTSALVGLVLMAGLADAAVRLVALGSVATPGTDVAAGSAQSREDAFQPGSGNKEI